MAMSASITILPATGYVNQPLAATLTVSNSGSSAVNVNSIVGTAIASGASYYAAPVAIGDAALGPGETISVPASGSLKFNIPFTFFGTSKTGNQIYNCGANVQTSDGSVFSPTPATALIQPLPVQF